MYRNHRIGSKNHCRKYRKKGIRGLHLYPCKRHNMNGDLPYKVIYHNENRYYTVVDNGIILSYSRKSRLGKPVSHYVKDGQVCCKVGGKSIPLGKEVAKAFIPNPNGYKYVIHKDGDIYNNDVSNLEWSNHYDKKTS